MFCYGDVACKSTKLKMIPKTLGGIFQVLFSCNDWRGFIVVCVFILFTDRRS